MYLLVSRCERRSDSPAAMNADSGNRPTGKTLDGLTLTDQIRAIQKRVRRFRPRRNANPAVRGGARGARITGPASEPANAITVTTMSSATRSLVEHACATCLQTWSSGEQESAPAGAR